MADEKNLECSAAPKLIFSCSGAADVGALSDRAARRMTREGAGKMYCLAGVGGRVPGIMKTTEAAEKILAIDGCQLDCVKNCLEQAGFLEYDHMRVTDLGMKKGETQVNDENTIRVVEKGRELLA